VSAPTFNELVQYGKCFVLISCSATQAEADKLSFLSTLRKQSARVIEAGPGVQRLGGREEKLQPGASGSVGHAGI